MSAPGHLDLLWLSCCINRIKIGKRRRKKDRGKGNNRGDCSSASVPSQHELFLDPQKQRSRIAFHPLCSYVVSPSNVALGDCRHVFAPMFRPNLRQKTNALPISPPIFFVLPTLLYLHVLQPHCTLQQFVFPHPVSPQGNEKMCSVLPLGPYDHHWPGCKVVSSVLLRGQPDRMLPLWGKTFCELNSW